MNRPDSVHAEDLPYWLALHRAPLIGSRRFGFLLEHFDSPEAVFRAGRLAWEALRIPERTMDYLASPDWKTVEADLGWLAAGEERHCLLAGRPGYPALLAEIADPPAVLFVSGDPGALALRHIGIVGSRNPTPAGVRAAREFAAELAGLGWGVVSGLAAGIDAAGHEGTLDGRGITVAVAGTGPDRVYPRQHQALAERILQGGGSIVTEYPPGTGPVASNFPRRNRIISGLSLGVLVVEAASQSGSLITARLALEQNRDVFAIPGSIYNPLARGCNDLIREGARLTQSVADILEEYPLGGEGGERLRQLARNTPEPVLVDAGILKYIAYEPLTVDTLVAVSGLPVESIASQLLELELQGVIAAMPGGAYVRVR